VPGARKGSRYAWLKKIDGTPLKKKCRPLSSPVVQLKVKTTPGESERKEKKRISTRQKRTREVTKIIQVILDAGHSWPRRGGREN